MADWDAEWTLDPEAVFRAAGSPARWRHLGSGWDCEAWVADEAVVWRAARRRVGVEALAREAAVMPVLAPRLPSSVPVPVWVEAVELPALTRHALVPGREMASSLDLSAVAAGALGQFLRALHAPDLVDGVRPILPVDPIGRSDPARRVPSTHRRLDELADVLDVTPLRAVVDAAAGPAPALDAVLHGDLHPRHVLVDDAGRLTGVIDWGDSCIGARAVDLMIATALDAESRAAFIAAYGAVDDASWRHARLIGVAIGGALLASDIDGPVGASARRWLGRLAADAEPN